MTNDKERSAELAITSAERAAGRLFRVYEQHCRNAGPDTLFLTLTALHSFNDQLDAALGKNLLQIEEFLALKALRNFAHHQEDIESNVRVIPAPATSDLAFLCLVRRDQIERAIESVDKRWREAARSACRDKFHWYGQAVNINPCLFNLMVHAYELLAQLNVQAPDEDIAKFKDSYQFERANNHPHYIDGRLLSHLESIEGILGLVVAQLPVA